MTRCVSAFSSFLILLCLFPSSAHAQPGDYANLKQQLERLQKQLSEMEQPDDEPFSQRVREIGRQRQSTPPVPKAIEMQIRFYDLSDIFSISPQYPAQPIDIVGSSALLFPNSNNPMVGGGGFGGGGGGVFSIPPRQGKPHTMNLESARISVETLVDAIQQTVEPDEWEDLGGGDAKIITLGNTLLISATDSMHTRITSLINLFREHWGKLRTVSIEAFWIYSDPATISGLLKAESRGNRVAGSVDESDWGDFFDSAKEESRIAYSSTLTGHNGQTLHTVSGTQKHFFSDVTPLNSVQMDKKGNESSFVSGLRPVRDWITEGAAIQVTPLATRGGNFVILDLHARVNELVEEPNEESKKVVEATAVGPQGQPFTIEIDRSDYRAYRMSTTVRCPKDSIMLAGGMSYPSESDADASNMYLFVRTRVHTIEEDESDVNMQAKR